VKASSIRVLRTGTLSDTSRPCLGLTVYASDRPCSQGYIPLVVGLHVRALYYQIYSGLGLPDNNLSSTFKAYSLGHWIGLTTKSHLSGGLSQ
jgi:hypothetical protein